MKMKRVLCSLVAGAALLALAACGSGGGSKSESSGGNSGKTEITWWAFPVFTQKKLMMVSEPMKNLLSKPLKKQTRYQSEIGNHRLQVWS